MSLESIYQHQNKKQDGFVSSGALRCVKASSNVLDLFSVSELIAFNNASSTVVVVFLHLRLHLWIAKENHPLML